MSLDMLTTAALKVRRLEYKVRKALKIENEFSRRIKHRHTRFWSQQYDKDKLSYKKFYVGDPIEKWKDVENWQRKLSNKHNSRQFAIKFGCKVPDLYWQGRDYENINFAVLPNNFVIRPVTGSGGKMVFVMQNGLNLFDNRIYSNEQIIDKISAAINKNPKLEFLIEEFVTDEKGVQRVPDDFKLYMFNGEVGCIQVINRINPSRGKTKFYDEHWNPINRVQLGYDTGKYQSPPICLNEMLTCAKTLSKEYGIFARIDFYATQKGAVFGEITPTPFQGQGFTSFGNKLLIDKWDQFCAGLI